MATAEIIRHADKTSGIHPEQRDDEVLVSMHPYTHVPEWSTSRRGDNANKIGRYPFFVSQKELSENGWKPITVNLDDGSILRVWFTSADIELVCNNTLSAVQISFPAIDYCQWRHMRDTCLNWILNELKHGFLKLV